MASADGRSNTFFSTMAHLGTSRNLGDCPVVDRVVLCLPGDFAAVDTLSFDASSADRMLWFSCDRGRSTPSSFSSVGSK